jgi:predicted nucleic acid-binding protein
MMTIFLDSGPLALLTQPRLVPGVQDCRQWFASHASRGATFVVPEIIDYELRRELLRSDKGRSLVRLNNFVDEPAVSYLPLTTSAMRLSAQLWAGLRKRGEGTASDENIDVDVIAAAQAMLCEVAMGDRIFATTNVDHLARLMPAARWQDI